MIDIIGPYPPPFGGISVHIKRMSKYLSSNMIPVIIYNHGYSNYPNVKANHKSIIWYLQYLTRNHTSVIHIHQTLSGLETVYIFILAKMHPNAKILFTIHNSKYDNDTIANKLRLSLIKRTRYNCLIVVSEYTYKFFMSHGINAKYLPAYVPVKEMRVWEKKKYIAFNIWKIDESNLTEIYGLDILIRAFGLLSDNYELHIFVGSDPGPLVKNIYQIIDKERIQKDKVKLIINEEMVLYLPYYRMFVRPNRIDGFGVSIQEALDLGVVAIASDVCKRPDGTILFKNGDYYDLFSKIKAVISMNKTEYFRQIKKKESLTYHIQLLHIYQSYLTNY